MDRSTESRPLRRQRHPEVLIAGTGYESALRFLS
jgi:hypothetical protein